MANPSQPNNTRESGSSLHPGSSVEDARAVGGKGDFGVPESNVVERSYTSTNTKRADPGGAPARGGADESRTSGVGGNASGPGSSSGGDVDTDIIGVGTGGSGIAASGKIHEPAGPDDVDSAGRNTTLGNNARGSTSGRDARERGVYRRETSGTVKGSTVQSGSDDSAGDTGADSASRTHADDDSFAGEVSSDEASGRNDAP